MTNFLRGYRAETDETSEGTSYHFIASTSGVKRDGLEIDQSKWQLDGYRSNPVVLLNHDYSSLPIGTAEVEVRDGALHATVTWSAANPAAEQVRALYDEGTLRAVSVGWRDTDEGHELLDVSAVAVPGDPDALIQRARAWAARVLEETETDDEPAEVEADEPDEQPTVETWDEIAAGMVAVFDVADSADDDERLREYKRLLPAYRLHERTAPEFMLATDIAMLEPREWRGLFLEDELIVSGHRAGKVLSTRNEGKLRQAADLIREVLRSAGSDDDADGERAAHPDHNHDWLADLAAAVETGEEAAEADLLAELYGGL